MKLKYIFLSALVGLTLALVVASHQLHIASVWPTTPFQLWRTPFWDLVDMRSQGALELGVSTSPGDYGLMSIKPNSLTLNQG